MEYQKISNLLNEAGDKPKTFQTKKWIEINDDSQGKYQPESQIKFKTTSLISALCDYADAYILVKGEIGITSAGKAVIGDDEAARTASATARATAAAAAGVRDRAVALKNCAPFINCISEINNTQVDNAKDLDETMPMYNLLEYSKNYAEANASLYQIERYTGAALASDEAGFVKRSVGTTALPVGADGNSASTLATEIIVPLKYLSNF